MRLRFSVLLMGFWIPACAGKTLAAGKTLKAEKTLRVAMTLGVKNYGKLVMITNQPLLIRKERDQTHGN